MLFVVLGFVVPIAIVLLMRFLPEGGAKGWKTNTQGTILLVLAAIQTTDLSFLPPDVVTAMVAGAGFAVLLASKFTERA